MVNDKEDMKGLDVKSLSGKPYWENRKKLIYGGIVDSKGIIVEAFDKEDEKRLMDRCSHRNSVINENLDEIKIKHKTIDAMIIHHEGDESIIDGESSEKCSEAILDGKQIALDGDIGSIIYDFASEKEAEKAFESLFIYKDKVFFGDVEPIRKCYFSSLTFRK